MKGNKNNKSCDHIGLFSRHPKKLINFYVEKLGFKVEKQDIVSKAIINSIFGIDLECRLTRLSLGRIKIEIFSPSFSPKRTKFSKLEGINHWGFSTGDRRRFCQKLIKDKVKIITIERNSHKVYFIKDPQDNLIEIRD